jgi:hypothetical protein
MGGNELGEQLNGVSTNVAALVFQASCGQLSGCLPSLGELLLQVAYSHEHLDGSAAAVRVDIEKSLFEDIEKGIDLGLVIFTALFLSAQIGNEVPADLNDCTAEGIRLEWCQSRHEVNRWEI